MNTQLRFVIIPFLFLALQGAMVAQTPRDLCVLLHANYSSAPKFSITLAWNADSRTASTMIFRKDRDGQSFSASANVTLVANENEWTDTAVVVGKPYEYRVLRTLHIPDGTDSVTGLPRFDTVVAAGYIVTGREVIPTASGKLLMVIDSSLANGLNNELDTYEQDVLLEGYTVERVVVSRSEEFSAANVEAVRAAISQSHKQEPLSSVVLIGRVAVPYSGRIAPDGHTDHVGAWPADGIYGDVNGTYSDNSVNNPNPSRASNNNIPGDGKYDQDRFGTTLELAVGRIDAYNMPAFSGSELALLKNYFHRNHEYRTGKYNVHTTGIIDDNFGGYGEYFATSGWRNFVVFGGDSTVTAGDYFESYSPEHKNLWMFGCGGGTDNSAGGVGTTTDFATKPTNAIFSLLFGSYFGDYDTKNNFLRAAIFGEGGALTCAWAGRPSWYLHHMAMGESIGYSSLVSQNNLTSNFGAIGTYVPNIITQSGQVGILNTGDRGVHIALMGDPTLKTNSKPQPAFTGFVATTEYPNKVNLQWDNNNPTAKIIITRKRGNNPAFQQLAILEAGSVSFTDSVRNDGTMQYRIQPLRADSTVSGHFYQRGAIAQTSVVTTGISEEVSETMQLDVYPQPASTSVSISMAPECLLHNSSIVVRNAAGEIVAEYSMSELSISGSILTLPTQQLATGIYTLSIGQCAATFVVVR